MAISILLGSGGISTEERKKIYVDLVREHFSQSDQVLFIPYASDDHEFYTNRMQSFLGKNGPELLGIETFEDPIRAVNSANGIYLGGGNSFLLVKSLHERNLLDSIRDRITNGIPYLGISAGSNIACPSMMTTNDMPIVYPPTFKALGIVPFQINPHYHPGKVLFKDGNEISKHYGESRAQRIAEFHKHNSTPVLGMWEGSFVHWDGTLGRLTGRATAFIADEEPVEMYDGAEFNSLLSRDI